MLGRKILVLSAMASIGSMAAIQGQTIDVRDGARASEARQAQTQPGTPVKATQGTDAAARLDWHRIKATPRRYPKNAGWTDRRYRRAAAKLRRQAKARRASR